MKCICVNFLGPDLHFLIPLGTLPWQPIFGKICKVTFIEHAGISQRIRISKFRLQFDKGHNFCYILCNFGDDIGPLTVWWDVKPCSAQLGPLTAKISQGVSVPFGTRRQKSTYHTKYLSKYWTKRHQLFSIGRLMYADYKTEIIFAVVEETLLW